MSIEKQKKYSSRKSAPATRPPKYPHLGERIKEILLYFGFNQSELSRRTGIKQSSLSKCIRGRGSIVEAGVKSLSKNLPEPIPMWWLAAGPKTWPLGDAIKNTQGKILLIDDHDIPFRPEDSLRPSPARVDKDKEARDQALEELLNHLFFFYGEQGEKWEHLRRQIVLFGKDLLRQHPELGAGAMTAQAVLDIMAALDRIAKRGATTTVA